MFETLVALTVATAVGGVAALVYEAKKSRYGDGWGLFVGLILLVASFLFLCVVVGNSIDSRYSKYVCTKWGQQTEREVKFAKYNDFGYECLTRSKDSKWIPKSQIRDFGEND